MTDPAQAIQQHLAANGYVDETHTAQPVVPTDPPSEFAGNRAVIGPPDAKEDVHEYSGMVHPFPNTSGNANAAQ